MKLSPNTRMWLITFAVILIPTTAYIAFDWYSSNHSTLPYYGPQTEEGADHTIPVFEFTDQNNDVVGSKDLNGMVTVVNYFFTSCPTICPEMTRNIKSVQEMYLNDDYVQFFSLTVDPKRDTAGRFQMYIDKHAIEDRNWHFLTGEKMDLYRLARQGFMVSATDGDGGPGDFIHSENLVLVDQHRKIRGFYDGTDKSSVQQLIKDIAKLKKQKV